MVYLTPISRRRRGWSGVSWRPAGTVQAAACSEQITRICAAASLPKLDCTTAQIGGSGALTSLRLRHAL